LSEKIEYNLPEAKKVLIIAPHPDDELIGCGGSILLYRERGTPVDLLFLTRGENIDLDESVGRKISDVGTLRQEEAERVASEAGVNPQFLHFPDGSLCSHQPELRKAVEEAIGEINPGIVFAPSPIEPHPDHRTSAVMMLKLLYELRSFRLAFYEVGEPIRYNTLVDISSVVERKKSLFRHYMTSSYNKPDLFAESTLGLNLYRSLQLVKRGYYESFLILDHTFSLSDLERWLTFDLRRGFENL